MINFFRKKRKKMAADNNTLKYARYAIGEIVLVVVGILIALQINNWNENQKKAALELDILKEVRNGLTTDLEDAIFNLNSHKEKFRSQQIFIEWLESNRTFHDSLSSHIGVSHYGTYFQSNEGPYQTLKQLGMRTIKNDSLRNQISSLYDLSYQQYDVYNGVYKEMSDKLHLESANYFNELDFFRNNMKPTNIKGLRLSNNYKFHLKTLTNFNEILIYQTIPNIVDQISKTLIMINTEIENRN